MTDSEILEELNRLPPPRRLKLLECTVRQLHEDFERAQTLETDQQDALLRRAAEALLSDYTANKKLTAFTVLDTEPFHG